VICCTSADEASKLNVAVASGFAAANASPISVNDSVNDAAANTVMSPASPGAEPVGASDVSLNVVQAVATVAKRSAAPASSELSLAERVCLGLIAQHVAHGWALGTLLAPDGEIGRIWSLSRPLTYRAIDGLVDKGLITRRGQAAGRGRDRVILAATPVGRRLAKRWLDEPVQHLRDVRTELLVKLQLRARIGLDNEPLLAAQQQVFDPTIDVLTSTHPDEDLVDLWRRESARSVRRFLDQALHPIGTPHTANADLQLSARNQLRGSITAIRHGDVMSTVNATLDDSQPVTAAITKDAATDLDLAPGDSVIVIIKSTEVIVARQGAIGPNRR
jgi:PadR family transcriptional regulator AphA